MASSETARRTTSLLPGAHRAVRRLATGEGPFPGVLVTDGEAKAVLRDAEGLAGWGAWPFAGARHVAAPVDVVRRADGHDVLLPWCTERVSVFLGRRAALGRPLSGGEVSTLTVSVLRGIGELGADPRGVHCGEWWLTDEGCPVLVLGDGEHARIAAAGLVEAIAAESADRVQRRVLEGVAEGLRGCADRPEVPRRQIDGWESELLAIAAPRPLERDVEAVAVAPPVGLLRGTGSSASAGAERAHRPTATRTERTGARRGGVGAGLRQRGARPARRRTLVRHAVAQGRAAVAGWSAQRASAPRGAAGGTQASSTTRRRPPMLAVALAAAGAVLVAGLLWPAGKSEGKEEHRPGDGAARGLSVPERIPPADRPEPGSADEIDGTRDGLSTGDRAAPGLEEIAMGLVSVIRECRVTGDETCGDAVVPGAAHVLALFESPPRPEESVRLVDEYGGAAVLRLSHPADGAEDATTVRRYERMLVLVRVDEKWLVRDAYDVADQPG